MSATKRNLSQTSWPYGLFDPTQKCQLNYRKLLLLCTLCTCFLRFLRKDDAQRQYRSFFLQISHQIHRFLNVKGTLNISSYRLIQSEDISSSLMAGNQWSLFYYLMLQKIFPVTCLSWQDSWCFYHQNISWGFNTAEVSITKRCVSEFTVSYRHL